MALFAATMVAALLVLMESRHWYLAIIQWLEEGRGLSAEVSGLVVLPMSAVAIATAVWLLVALGILTGIPQGLDGLANQNALYRQADPARMGTAAGLLRTFMYLGAMASSAAVAATFPNGALTGGLHQLATFMLGCAALLLVVTLVDRSLRTA
jgi:sugar phosphate permease